MGWRKFCSVGLTNHEGEGREEGEEEREGHHYSRFHTTLGCQQPHRYFDLRREGQTDGKQGRRKGPPQINHQGRTEKGKEEKKRKKTKEEEEEKEDCQKRRNARMAEKNSKEGRNSKEGFSTDRKLQGREFEGRITKDGF
jgi:hypothetical protein